MKNTIKKIFTEKRINTLLFLCAFFIISTLLCHAQTSSNPAKTPTATPAQTSAQGQQAQVFYLLDVIWDLKNNTLALKSGTDITLTNTSLTKDAGSGSQFYAMLVNSKDQPAINSKKEVWKYYLGKWALPTGQTQGEIKFTVPYLATGAKLVILDAKSNKIVLVADIFKLTHPVPIVAAKNINPTALQNKIQITQASNKSAVLGWMIILILILILIAGGYFIFRFYKKRKIARELAQTNLQGPQNKISS